ncbi:MAG TPA: MBL fold metallo-hydrolase [Bacteroidales bacterium]
MKNFKLLATAAFCFVLTSIVLGQNMNGVYKANRIDDKTWRIVENNTVNIYLVEGKDSALIIDTGYGTGDLKAFLQTLTKLPLIIVNTHGHGDHTGADRQFSKVYAHPADFYMIDAAFERAKQKENKLNVPVTTLVPVKEGFVFNLGDRKLEVMEVPGHTHGSIVLFDKKNKILFAGDHSNSTVWLFLKDCYPLEVYLKSLEKVEERIDDFNIIMPGHNTPLEKTFISEQIGAVKGILDGTCNSVHYDHPSNTSGALVCKYKTAEVAYDPNNLRVKK